MSLEGLSLGIQQVGVLSRLKKNAYIWRAGDPGDFAFLIASGWAEVCRPSPLGKGRETLMGIFGPGDVIGLSAVTRHTPYPATAQVISSQVEGIKLFIRPLLAQIRSPHHLEVQNWVREMTLRHEQVLRDKIDILSSGSIEERIHALVLNLVNRFGIRESKQRIRVPLGMTRSQVARMVDARVESVIRILSRWTQDGWIRWNRQELIVLKMGSQPF